MNQNYVMDKLTLTDLRHPEKIVIPKFQRGIVWTTKKRKEFIDTVKSGDPFGVVLVSQAKPGAPYVLIDGLQRLSTLRAYDENPLEFIDENDKFIDAEKLTAIFSVKYTLMGRPLPNDSKLDKEKKTFLKRMIASIKKEPKIPKAMQIWPQMAEILQIDVNRYEALSAFTDFYDTFVENLKLPDIIIHAIVYQGPEERLPTVFENLNTTSVALTKYEIFSSKWSDLKYIINDEEIIKNVWSKYANLKRSSSFSIDTSEEDLRENGITLFEYCFAFSEIVNNEDADYKFLFTKGKKSTDPTGFNLIALACGLAESKSDDLWKDEFLGHSSQKFLIDLKEALLDCIKIVANNLREWVYDLKGTAIKNSSLYQIYHLVISVFKNIYTLNLVSKTVERKETQEAKEWLKNFNMYSYKWYLYHHLIKFWSENRQSSNLLALTKSALENEYYVTNISRNMWENAIKEYMKGLHMTATTRSIEDDSELLLNYLYKFLIKQDENRKKYFRKETENGEEIVFDIEHIVPVNKFDKFDEDFPISALGNLCYLPIKDNRSKRDKTIYEYALDRPSLTYNEEFLSLIDYPTRQELEFINCPQEQFQNEYLELIEKRENSLLNRFVELIMDESL